MIIDFKLANIRSVIMGISIIWIILFHAEFPIPFLSSIIGLGYLGVDVFIFVSAYSLCYSWNANKSLRKFYIRRLVRILPLYYLVMILVWGADTFIFNVNQGPLWQMILMLGFYVPQLEWNCFLWYIPAILLLYIFFPLFYKNINILKKNFVLVLSLIFIANYFIYLYIIGNGYSKLFLLFPLRIVVFICGIMYAQNEDKYISILLLRKRLWLFLLFFIIIFIYIVRKYAIGYIGGTPLTVSSFIIALPGFFLMVYYISRNKIMNIFLGKIGTYTFELYLIHETLFRWSGYIFHDIDLNYIKALLILFSFPIAIVLNKIGRLFNRVLIYRTY